MAEKIISLDKNFNNKLGCDIFVHVDKAPKGSVTEAMMNEQVFIFHTLDGSHENVSVQVFDLVRFSLDGSMPWSLVWLSHAMDADQFITHFLNTRKGVALGEPMAAYYYRKINVPSPVAKVLNPSLKNTVTQ